MKETVIKAISVKEYRSRYLAPKISEDCYNLELKCITNFKLEKLAISLDIGPFMSKLVSALLLLNESTIPLKKFLVTSAFARNLVGDLFDSACMLFLTK